MDGLLPTIVDIHRQTRSFGIDSNRQANGATEPGFTNPEF